MNRDHDEHEIAGAICLTMGVPLRLEPAAGGREIHAVDGRIWVTEENDVSDYLAASGGTVRLPGCGAIVVETLTPFACIKVREINREGIRRGTEIGAPRERGIGIEA